MTENVVWKHELRSEVNDLMLTPGAKVLHVAEQHGVVCLWETHALEAPGPLESRQFVVAGTGNPYPAGGEHVGSLLALGGTLVFHVFEGPRP